MPRLAELDGLRGLAILAVLVFHLISKPLQEYPGSLSPLYAGMAWLGGVGWLGVDLFFVLSGFLITRLLIEGPQTRSAILTFWARRVVRILPLYYVVLVVYFGLGRMLYPGGEAGYASLFRGEWWVWLHATNIGVAVAGSWEALPTALAHFWSLSLEEQFYFVWPFFVLGAAIGRVRRIALLIVLVVPVLRAGALLVDTIPLTIYVSLPMRADALAIGALLATGGTPRRVLEHPFVASIAAVLLAIVLVTVGTGFRSSAMQLAGYSSAAVLFAALLARVSAGTDTVLCRALRASWLRWIGVRSYGVYLLHPLFSMTIDYFLRSRMELSPGGMVVAAFLSAGISFVVAGVSWQWFERPLLLLRERWLRSPSTGH